MKHLPSVFFIFFMIIVQVFVYSQCPPGYELRNVKCGEKYTSKCLPVDYKCSNCWTIVWEPCPGKHLGASDSYSTYGRCEEEAQKVLARTWIKTCEEGEWWGDKTKWKIYLYDCGNGTGGSGNGGSTLTLSQRIELLKQKLSEYLQASFNNSSIGKLYNDLMALKERLSNGDLTQDEAEREIQELELAAKQAGVKLGGSGSGGSGGGSASGSVAGGSLPQNGTVGNMTWYRNPNGSYQLTLNNTNAPPMNYSAAEAEQIIKKGLKITQNGGTFNADSHQALTTFYGSGSANSGSGSSAGSSPGRNTPGVGNISGSSNPDLVGASPVGGNSTSSSEYKIPQTGHFGNLEWYRLPDGSYQLTITNGDQAVGMLYSKSEAESIIRGVIKKYNGRPFNVSSHDDLTAKLNSAGYTSSNSGTSSQGNTNGYSTPPEFRAMENELNRIAANGGNVTESDANRLMNIAQNMNLSESDINRLMQQNQAMLNQLNTAGSGSSGYSGTSSYSSPNYSSGTARSSGSSGSLSNPLSGTSGFNSLNNPLNSYSGGSSYSGSSSGTPGSDLVMSGISGYNGTSSYSQSSAQMNQMTDRFKQISESNGDLQKKGLQMMQEASRYTDMSTNLTGSAIGLGVVIAGAVQESRERAEAEEKARLKRIEENRKFELRDSILMKESLKWPSSSHKSSTVYLAIIGWTNTDYENFDFYLSDVIPVHKTSDGSWPFKDKVIEGIYKNPVIAKQKKIIGYFNSPDLAYNHLELLINKLKSTNLKKINTIQLKKPATNPQNGLQSQPNQTNHSQDFWND